MSWKLPLLCFALVVCASAARADYPPAEVFRLDDGIFYKVPIATADGRYDQLDVEVSPRRFVFCSEERAAAPLQQQFGIRQMLECVVERGGAVSTAKLGYIQMVDADGSPVKATQPRPGAITIDRKADGKSYYRVPVSTLTQQLDSIERELTDQHYLFCSKVRREAQKGSPQYEMQCFVEQDGRISRVREEFTPTVAELKALEDYVPPEQTPRGDGPYHGV